MKDEDFLNKINGPFICLTAAILCYSLRCWQTGICIDNVAFTRVTSVGKKNNVYWQVSKVSGSPTAQAYGHFCKQQVLELGERSANG